MQRPLLLVLLLGSVKDLRPAAGLNASNDPLLLWPYVEAVLEARPDVTQACSDLTFSAAKSVESRGEQLWYIWGFGSDTPLPLRTEELASVLEAATKSNSPELEISPDVLSAAVSALENSAVGQTLSTKRLEIRLGVRNDLGNSSETVASAGLVGSSSQAEPVVIADGKSNVQLKYFQELGLSVLTAEAPYAISCANRGAGDSAGSVRVNWAYKELAGSSWTELQEVTKNSPPEPGFLQDLSPRPNFVQVPAFSFTPGGFYMLRAQASFDQRPSLAPKSTVLFKVSVEDWPQPIVNIAGPDLASTGCAIELDASKSWDPAYGDWSTAASQGVAGLTFRWSCFSVIDVGAHDYCADLPHFTDESKNKTNGRGTEGATFKIAGNLLPPGTYLFSVEVGRLSGSGLNAVGKHAVEVVGGVFTPLVLDLPGFTYSAKTSLDDGVPSVVSVMAAAGAAGEGCTAPAAHWQWGLVLGGPRPLLLAMLPTSLKENGGKVEIHSESPRPEDEVALKAGSTYYFQLFQAEDRSNLDELQEGVNVTHKKLVSEALLMDLRSVARTPIFVPDQAPYGGTVSVKPGFLGEALRTAFLVRSAQWKDEDVASLEYEFYSFPLLDPSLHANMSNSSSSSIEGLGFFRRHDGSRRSVNPEINWDNPDDPLHWLRQGGSLVRSWGRASQAFLHAAPGHHLVVSRVRDGFGHVSTAFAQEPLEVEALTGFELEDAKGLLSRVEAMNNANDILEAAAAIIGQTEASLDVEQCRPGGEYENEVCWYIDPAQVAERVLTSFHAVPDYLEADADMVSKTTMMVDRALDVALKTVHVSVDVSLVFGESTRPIPNKTDEGDDFNVTENVPLLPHVTWLNFSAIEIDEKVVEAAEPALRLILQHLLEQQDAASSPLGLDLRAAKAVLRSVTHMLYGTQYGEKSVDLVAETDRSSKALALLQLLSSTSFSQLVDGEALELDYELSTGAASRMLLSKVHCPDGAGQDIRTPGLKIPRKVANGNARRLTESSCESLEIVQTKWHGINPHAWAPAGFGETDLLLPNSTVEDVSFSRCGQPLQSTGLNDPVEIDLEFNPPVHLRAGYVVTYKCAFFDRGLGAWSTQGMTLKETVTNMSTKMTCLSTRTYGSFAAVFSISELIVNVATDDDFSGDAAPGGLDGGAIAGIVVGVVIVCCGGLLFAIFVWRATSTSKVDAEDEEEEEQEESNLDSKEEEIVEVEIEEETDFTRLRKAAEAGEITAAELLTYHSNKQGMLHPELIAAVDKHHMKSKGKRAEDIKPPPAPQILPPTTPKSVRAKAKIKAKKANDVSPGASPGSSPSPPRQRVQARPRPPPLEGSRNPRPVHRHQPATRSPSPARRGGR
mmetsp:Transcript_83195/g.146968  ORF Transcript_83195/g.146968 Transcript_83195/m.146968 type:complete len:1353 (-) Transcript_83195:33-4091(-)